MTAFHRCWTMVRGVRLHDRSAGCATGSAVVFLHGLAVSHRYLLPTAGALADRHRVVLPDLPGFGHSDKPGHAYDVGEHADFLGAWLDARGLDRVAVVGHSFGAEVAARLAVRQPERVSALVLAAPTSDPAARTRRGLIGRWAADLVFEPLWQAPVLIRDVVDARPWRVLATVGHSVRNPVEQDLRRLPVPPLVLGGALDTVSPPRWRLSVAAMTGGRSVTIPEAAHNALTTSGRRAADAIAAYLGEAR
jgi:pimeloyl-ACP methyl ester carboxylesterase